MNLGGCDSLCNALCTPRTAMSRGGCVVWMVFCNTLCTPMWCRNSDELGGLCFVLQCTLHPKDGDELEGLHFMGGVSHHALHPNLIRELQRTWGAALHFAMHFVPQELR